VNKETRYGNNKNDTLTLFSCFVREKRIVNRTSELIHNYITRLREQCSKVGKPSDLFLLRNSYYVIKPVEDIRPKGIRACTFAQRAFLPSLPFS